MFTIDELKLYSLINVYKENMNKHERVSILLTLFYDTYMWRHQDRLMSCSSTNLLTMA